MDNIIEIKDLSFKYNDLYIFKNLNLNIKKNTFLTIMGPSSTGKTTLCNLICNKLDNKGSIRINGTVGLVNKKNYNCLVEEIISNKDIIKSLKLNNILSCNFEDLNNEEQALVEIGEVLSNTYNIIIIDNVLNKLNKDNFNRVIKLLNKLNKDGITIINITNNIEESLFSKELLILNNQIIIYDDIFKVYEQEKLLKENNIEIPFMVSLSNKLKYYNLLDDTVLDIDKMVNILWK